MLATVATIRAPGRNSWRSAAGGEAADAEDSLSEVRITNLNVLTALETVARFAEAMKGNR